MAIPSPFGLLSASAAVRFIKGQGIEFICEKSPLIRPVRIFFTIFVQHHLAFCYDYPTFADNHSLAGARIGANFQDLAEASQQQDNRRIDRLESRNSLGARSHLKTQKIRHRGPSRIVFIEI